MARKRDERAIRAAHRKERNAQSYLAEDINFASFANQLAIMGLKLREIPGDGNCLFRALGDQLDGHGKFHVKHREDVVKFMQQHRVDFEPFVEDDVSFERHIDNLRRPGTYAGNDAIVAFARLHKLTVVIHQMNSPLWQIHGTDDKNAKQLHISYHNGDHYSSVRKLSDESQSPTGINLKSDETSVNWPSLECKSSVNSCVHHDGSSVVNSLFHHNSGTEDKWEPKKDDRYSSNINRQNRTDGNVARAIRDKVSIAEQISHETGCTDLNLITESLDEHFMDIDATVAYITQIMSIQAPNDFPEDSSIWSPEGTAARIFGKDIDMTQTSTRPKSKLSTSQVKKKKKLQKKERAVERHKQFLLGKASVNTQSNSDEDPVIVQRLKTLNI